MRQITFTVGTGFYHDGHAIEENVGWRLKHEAIEGLTHMLGGVTVFSTDGGWFGPSGMVKETGLQFVALTDASDSLITDVAEYLLGLFKQESVMITKQDVSVRFVNREVAA